MPNVRAGGVKYTCGKIPETEYGKISARARFWGANKARLVVYHKLVVVGF